MGFNSVYQLLREEFDGIDARVLKAVAIEHSYDANEAFSVVLDEIIPYECMLKAPASAVLSTTPRNVPSIPGTTNKSVRSIPITTPSPHGKVCSEQKSVDRKQLVDIVGEGLSVAGPSRTYDAFVYPGELANSRMSNHPAKDEYANGKIGVKSQVPKKGCSEICCSLNALVVKASDSQTDQCASGIVKDLVKDLESDKKNLISAMESVLNILKDVEAKKQEAAAACETDDIHVKLSGDVIKNRPTLINEVTAIESRLLNLLKDKDKSLTILDDMRRSLQVQLAQAEEEIEKGKLIKLQKQAQMTEEMRLHKLAVDENLELQELLKEYDEELDMLQSELESISVGILMLKDEIDRDIHLRKPITHSASLNSSILSHESEDFTTSQVSKNFTKSEDLPSLKIHVSDSSFSSQESEDVNEVSVQESKYSESESKSAEHLAPLVSPLKRSSALSSSLSSDENDNTAQANASDQEASAVTPRTIILNPVQKTAVSHVSVHHEVPCKTSSPILTDVAAKLNTEATNASNDANDDDWDFCDHFDYVA
ncbi:hypothetical protein QQ045_022119 [Rhodiola kirilowii]